MECKFNVSVNGQRKRDPWKGNKFASHSFRGQCGHFIAHLGPPEIFLPMQILSEIPIVQVDDQSFRPRIFQFAQLRLTTTFLATCISCRKLYSKSCGELNLLLHHRLGSSSIPSKCSYLSTVISICRGPKKNYLKNRHIRSISSITSNSN